MARAEMVGKGVEAAAMVAAAMVLGILAAAATELQEQQMLSWEAKHGSPLPAPTLVHDRPEGCSRNHDTNLESTESSRRFSAINKH